MRKARLCLLLLASFCLLSVVAAGSESLVAVLLPPKWAMGSELMDLLDEFNELNVQVDVHAENIGPYEFWEDSTEAFLWGYVTGLYEWTITHTYEDFDLEQYDAVMVGPGHAHSIWLGDTRFTAQEILRSALEQQIPIGGVSFGAAALVSWGFLDGRSAAMPPYYQGVVTQGTNKAMFLREFPDVTFENASIWIDQTPGSGPIVTARYGAVRKFAREIAELI